MVALTVGAALLVRMVTAQRIAALDEAVQTRVQTVHALLVADRIPDSLAVLAPGEVVQILDADGQVLATSSNASVTLPIIAADLPGVAGSDGVSVQTLNSPYASPARVATVQVPRADLPQRWQAIAADGVVIAAAVPLADVRQTQRTLTLLLSLVFPVLALGLALVVWLVLGRALRPVEDLRAAADEVAATGGPGSLPVPQTGELAALAQTLNAMLDRLQTTADGERAAASAARAAAQRQRSFVADAAHELRSPLASLSTALEVAQRHPQAYPQPELLADLEADVLRLQVLVEDLLLLARVGSRPLRSQPIDLVNLAREVVEALGLANADIALAAPSVSASELQVSLTGTGRAEGDPGAVARILRNVVSNAARHARSRVEILIDDGCVWVEDDGAGIEPEQRERVFERFVRLEEARERDAGGSGLGLAIARELAREQGGDVQLAGATGGGVRAVLTLPQPPVEQTGSASS